MTYPFKLAPLRFPYDALEPFLDATTLRLHHDRHHRGYVDKLNAALADHAPLHGIPLVQLLHEPGRIPREIRAAVRNHGGGHLNHALFWDVIGPPFRSGPGRRTLAAINANFGSFARFQAQFGDAAVGHFGAGWIFLVADARAPSLEIRALPDHQCVTAGAETALLVCDVWEHAYYLRYHDRRSEYVDAFWDVVAWDRVEQRLAAGHALETSHA